MKALSWLIGTVPLASTAHAKDVAVPVNGHGVHLDVVTPARLNPSLPMIVFESGLGARGTRDWRRVVRVMPNNVRFVRYDRPGLGKSEPDDEPPTPRQIAQVLHEAPKQAGIPPPYLLVGHSLGGARVRMFTALYPDDVAGMVFVDPTADFLRGGADQDLHDIFEPSGLGAKERDEMGPTGKLNPDVPKPVAAELQMAYSFKPAVRRSVSGYTRSAIRRPSRSTLTFEDAHVGAASAGSATGRCQGRR